MKTPRNITVFTIILSTLIMSLVFGSYLEGQSSYSATSSNPPHLAFSYLIFKDGMSIYAKNGSTGLIDYSSTNAAIVVQSSIDSLPRGGKIFLRSGEYEINNTIIVASNIIFEGEGYGTVLKASTDGMDTLLKTLKSSNVTPRNFRLNGDYKAYTLLGIITKDGAISENIVCENIWLHSNKRNMPRSVLWRARKEA